MRGFCPREGDSHPRGRRAGGAPLRRRRRSGAHGGQVLVELRAASMNHLDVWIRKGLPSVPKPRILGADGAGVIAGTDERVVINPGIIENGRTHIIGETRDGTHAELIAVPRDYVHPIPGDLSFEEAAAFPLVFETAYRMLVSRRSSPGGRVGADLGHRRRRGHGSARDRKGARCEGRSSPRRATRSSSTHAGSERMRSSTTRRETLSLRSRRRPAAVLTSSSTTSAMRHGSARSTPPGPKRASSSAARQPARTPGGAAPHLVEAALDPRLDDGDARRLPGRLRPDRGRPHPTGRRQRVPARRCPRAPTSGWRPASNSGRSCSRFPSLLGGEQLGDGHRPEPALREPRQQQPDGPNGLVACGKRRRAILRRHRVVGGR